MEKFNNTQIHSRDLFQPLPGVEKRIRTIMTKGIAGIGKTYCVTQYMMEWAEGRANKHIDLMLMLSFRELNVVKDERYNLLGLIKVFYSSLEMVTAEMLQTCKIVLIFDGLDESKLPLDFKRNEIVSDVTQTSSVDVLFTNLVKGNLLPSALLWITTRPAAAHRVPSECVDMTTEARGFSDQHKEDYFKNRFCDDERLAARILAHVRGSGSLYLVCRVPVFCWVTAVVLRHLLSGDEGAALPDTMTDMYKHFLVVQTKIRSKKWRETRAGNQQELRGDFTRVLKL